MKISVTNVTINFPVYVPIDDGDYETVKFYEENGYPVRTITLNGVAHLYAIVEGETKEQADNLNRNFNAMKRKEARALQKRATYETSYDHLVDEGYDAAVDNSDPSEIVAGLMMTEDLFEVFKELSAEKQRICRMTASDISEREIAVALGMPRSTFRDKRSKLFEEMKEKLK